MVSAALDRVQVALDAHGCTRQGHDWQCPSHDDRRASLSVKATDDGAVLIHCHAGCTAEQVCSALGLKMCDLFAGPPSINGHRRIVAIYDYVDEAGKLLYQVARFTPKGFAQRRPDGKGGWTWKLGRTRRVLYRLPRVRAAVSSGKRIWITEGEKDVHAVEAAGEVGTCNSGGAGKWRAEYADHLRGAKVAIIADADEPGRKHAQEVARSLEGVAAEVKIGEPAVGKDAADHLAAGCGLDELRHLAGDDRAATDGAHAWRMSQVKRERVRWLWSDRIPLGMLTLVIGDPGLGKSLLTCCLAGLVSRAGSDVLLLTAEDSPGATVRPRLEAVGADLERVRLVEVQRDGIADGLSLPDDAGELDRLVRQHGARLVVIDPLSAHLAEPVNSWRDQSVRRALAPLARMAAEHGCAAVVVAHLTKMRGGDPLYRAQGSIGIPAAARSALLLAREPDDPDGERGNARVLAHIKCNVAPQAQSLACRVEPVMLDGEECITTARISVTGTSSVSASELLSAPDAEARTVRDEAADLLRAELAEGPRAVKDIRLAASDAGIAWRTIERAKAALGVEARRESVGASGAGRWMWRLPAQDPHGQDRHAYVSDVGGLGGLAVPKLDCGESHPAQDRQDRHAGQLGSDDGVGDAEPAPEWAERLVERYREDAA